MRHTNYFVCIAVMAFASGCAFNRSLVLQTAVGPAPFDTGTRSPEGRLVVYSALGGGSSDPDSGPHHSDYRIYGADGKQLKYVNNWVGTFIEDPATVGLAPGNYTVAAKAIASGTVTVPVAIEAGKTTELRLDGSKLYQGPRTNAADFVRLPDGFVVGWAATEDTKEK